ncbi:hypothetical protein AURDEDRAFT_43339, partial [Auricularia subglabra TFB-10046 SS5]
GGRNLVVCIDGTSNQFSVKNTNVVELYSRLIKDDKQLTFYNSGIGTYAEPSWKSWDYRKQVIMNKLDLMFALRFEKIMLSAYAWLVDNYQPGDRIFLFGEHRRLLTNSGWRSPDAITFLGFSRGAYQVRALAAMIDVVGLLHKGNNDQIPFAYELYAASESKTRPAKSPASDLVRDERPQRSEDTPDRFKQTFSRKNVKVHFIGAWDTVSSVGIIRDKTLPGTTDGMTSACYFRHALALHEYRVKFLPEYSNGGAGPSERNTRGDRPHTKEVWFTGSHSDM